MSHYLHSALAELGALMEANRPPPLRLNYALCGRKRGFMSLSDAHSYEDGYWAQTRSEPCPEFGPGRDGWRDAEAEASEARAQFAANSYDTWVRRNCNPLTRGEVES